jgi:hypothetical protein
LNLKGTKKCSFDKQVKASHDIKEFPIALLAEKVFIFHSYQINKETSSKRQHQQQKWQKSISSPYFQTLIVACT